MMWTKPVLHWFSNIVNKSCVVRKANHYPSQSQGSFHQKYNNLTITLFLHCFYDEVLQDSSNFWECIWMKSLGVTTHTNKTSLVVLSNTSKVLFYNVLLINYHLSRFAFEMATKIDNRVRFASQSTSILNMRCSACFCEYQDTENILFSDWLPYSLNHRTFYPDVVVHCTLIEMGVTIITGTLLKLSLRQDFNMASYRDLLIWGQCAVCRMAWYQSVIRWGWVCNEESCRSGRIFSSHFCLPPDNATALYSQPSQKKPSWTSVIHCCQTTKFANIWQTERDEIIAMKFEKEHECSFRWTFRSLLSPHTPPGGARGFRTQECAFLALHALRFKRTEETG